MLTLDIAINTVSLFLVQKPWNWIVWIWRIFTCISSSSGNNNISSSTSSYYTAIIEAIIGM